MISGLSKEGLFGEVLALVSKMEDSGCISDAVTYEIVIRALFGKGKIEVYYKSKTK